MINDVYEFKKHNYVITIHKKTKLILELFLEKKLKFYKYI